MCNQVKHDKCIRDDGRRQRMHRHPYIHLYKPHPKDWYGETKQYLFRYRDGLRRMELLRRAVECRGDRTGGGYMGDGERKDNGCKADTSDLNGSTEAAAGMDTVITDNTNDLHKKLAKAEQDMKVVTEEVMALLDMLTDPLQQEVMIRRYIHGDSWSRIAARMQITVSDVKQYHQTALPILKHALWEMNYPVRYV